MACMIADIALMVEIGVFCAVRYKCNVEKVTGLVPCRFMEFVLPAALCGVVLAAMDAGIYSGIHRRRQLYLSAP